MEDTIAILRGLKERYEVHHGVRIKDSAIVAAATLSHRYITDRFLPDKAIDLIDEAAASLRIQIDSMPTEMDEMERRIMQLEIEKPGAEEGEAIANSKERLAASRERTGGVREKSNALKAHWKTGESSPSRGIADRSKNRSSNCKLEEQREERNGNLRAGGGDPLRLIAQTEEELAS